MPEKDWLLLPPWRRSRFLCCNGDEGGAKVGAIARLGDLGEVACLGDKP